MEEIELLSVLLVFKYAVRKTVILCEYLGKVLHSESVLVSLTYNRLNGYLIEACIVKCENVLGEVLVFVGECTADIILLIASSCNELLVLREDSVIASLSVCKNTEIVIYLLASVNGKNYIGHLTVDEIYLFVVQKESVCCDSEAELLVVFLFA